MNNRYKVAVLAGVCFIMGIISAVTLGPLVLSDGQAAEQPQQEQRDSEGYILTSTGTQCLSDLPVNQSGWVHSVSHGTTIPVTANLTVAHGPQEQVNVSVDRSGREFTIDIALTGATEQGTPARSSSSCATGTHLQIGTGAPNEVEQIRVVVDGRTVATTERDVTTAKLERLPSPVQTNGTETES